MIYNISAYILCGGKSFRFGSDKAKHIYKGSRLIDIITNEISKLFDKYFLVTDTTERFPEYNSKVITDIVHDKGPAGALLTALSHSENSLIFILPVDMPNINYEVIELFIAKYDSSKSINILKYKGKCYPTIGIYKGEKLINYLKERIKKIPDKAKAISLISLTDIFDYNIIDLSNFSSLNEQYFLNINYLEDIV